MANIYDMNAAIRQYDHVGAMQQGMRFGQEQRQIREARDREQQVRSLAPQIVAGDPAAYSQAAAIDPQAAGEFQGAGDGQLKRFKGFVGLIDRAREQAKQTGDWRHVDAALQQANPWLSQILGKPGPTAWPQGDPQWEAGWEGLKARLAGVEGLGTGQPTGFREFDMKARAAGLQPGTKEYEQAAKVALGVEGRAATGGFGFTKITGADGRERLARQNPRTGVAEVYDEATGDFVPLGGPAALNGGVALPPGQPGTTFETESGQALPTTRFTAADGSPVQFDAGVPLEFQQQVLQQPQQFEAAPGGAMANLPPVNRTPQQYRTGNPNLGVSRRPEDEAAAKRAAEIGVDLAYAGARGTADAQAAAQKETAVQTAKNRAEKEAGRGKAKLSLEQATSRVQRVDTLVDSILPRVGYATAGLASMTSAIPGTPAGDLKRDIGTLQAIAGFDELNAMRASSPTGGALGNVTERELAFLQSVVRNIENSQSPDQLRRNLEEFRREVKGSWERVQRAYQQDYGDGLPPMLDYDNGGNAGATPPATGTVLRYNPETGDFE